MRKILDSVRALFTWLFLGYRLLSYKELVQLVEQGVITNVDPKMINQSSIDLTLGSEIIVESNQAHVGSKYVGSKIRPLRLSSRDKFLSTKVKISKDRGYVLDPHEFVLAHTQQKFNLPDTISAEFSLKSSVGRMGLNHMLAGWCDAGWHNSVLTLELMNCLRFHHTEIREGDPIGQMKFFRHRRVPKDKSYAVRGRYNNDQSVEGIKE